MLGGWRSEGRGWSASKVFVLFPRYLGLFLVLVFLVFFGSVGVLDGIRHDKVLFVGYLSRMCFLLSSLHGRAFGRCGNDIAIDASLCRKLNSE